MFGAVTLSRCWRLILLLLLLFLRFGTATGSLLVRSPQPLGKFRQGLETGIDRCCFAGRSGGGARAYAFFGRRQVRTTGVEGELEQEKLPDEVVEHDFVTLEGIQGHLLLRSAR